MLISSLLVLVGLYIPLLCKAIATCICCKCSMVKWLFKRLLDCIARHKCLKLLLDWLKIKGLDLFIWYTQLLFGNKSVKFKDYKYRCIKVGEYYFKLNFFSMVPLIFCNICITGLIFTAMLRFFADISISNTCTTEKQNVDCFAIPLYPDPPTPITNCSQVTVSDIFGCYQVMWKPGPAIALVGGFILIVPKVGLQFMIWFNISILVFLRTRKRRIFNCFCYYFYLSLTYLCYVVSYLLVVVIQFISLEHSLRSSGLFKGKVNSILSVEDWERIFIALLIFTTFTSCPFSLMLPAQVDKESVKCDPQIDEGPSANKNHTPMNSFVNV